MLEFLVNNFASIATIIVGILSTGCSIAILLSKNSATKSTFTAIQQAVKMLPNLITVSENANSNKDGETKKAFVMTFIENMLAGRGIVMTEDIRNTISTHIDDIVRATKEMHIVKEISLYGKEDNQRNDISTVTGLRA